MSLPVKPKTADGPPGYGPLRLDDAARSGHFFIAHRRQAGQGRPTGLLSYNPHIHQSCIFVNPQFGRTSYKKCAFCPFDGSNCAENQVFFTYSTQGRPAAPALRHAKGTGRKCSCAQKKLQEVHRPPAIFIHQSGTFPTGPPAHVFTERHSSCGNPAESCTGQAADESTIPNEVRSLIVQAL